MIKRLIRLFLNQRVPKSNNDLINVLYSRKSCRSFNNKSVTKDIIDEVVKIGAQTPSTVNLQTWSFFPFTKEEWKEKFNNPIPFGAGAAIIVCADLKRLEIIDTVFKNYPLFFYTIAVMNASLSAMNMTIAIESMGMKSIMLSQTGRTGLCDVRYLKEKLDLPKLVFPITTLAFGYPKSDILFSPPKLNTSVVSHNKNYHLDIEEVKKWFEDMNFVCKMIDKEHLTEKFDKYLKLLPEAEEDLNAILEEIKN